jgi:hypothetical protein
MMTVRRSAILERLVGESGIAPEFLRDLRALLDLPTEIRERILAALAGMLLAGDEDGYTRVFRAIAGTDPDPTRGEAQGAAAALALCYAASNHFGSSEQSDVRLDDVSDLLADLRDGGIVREDNLDFVRDIVESVLRTGVRLAPILISLEEDTPPTLMYESAIEMLPRLKGDPANEARSEDGPDTIELDAQARISLTVNEQDLEQRCSFRIDEEELDRFVAFLVGTRSMIQRAKRALVMSNPPHIPSDLPQAVGVSDRTDD